jgi:2-dehydro-3-deoxyphosphogluconate aldolase / (4S)-4-hydroxy-2-oxoglutarate aldolase
MTDTHVLTQRRPIAEWTDFFATALAEIPLVAIMRHVEPDEAVDIARECWDHGIRLVEVTVERPEGVEALRAVVEAAGGRYPVGAGTVTTPERLRTALDAGASFAVAPDLDEETVRAADREGVPMLPGVFSPSEVGRAVRMGVTTVKAFPSSVLGPDWVSAIAGPFPELRVVGTGGVTAELAPRLLDAGALGVGIGAALLAEGVGPFVESTRRASR